MRRKQRTFLSVEQLEDRWVPATIKLISGSLFVSDQASATLLVQVTSTAGKVDIKDGVGGTITVSGVGSLISITGTNKSETITFKGNTGFNGNLLLNSGNGNDTISLGGPLGGSITALSGLGNDSVSLNATMTIGGGLSYQGGGGIDSVTVNATTSIGGDVSLIGISKFDQNKQSVAFRSNATVQSPLTTSTPLNFLSNGTLTIGKALSITSGSGADVLQLGGNATVNGTTQLSVGDGADTLLLGAFVTDLVNFGGSFNYNDTGGNDAVSLLGTVNAAGDMRFTFGSGDISYATTTPNFVGGNLSITAANGNGTFGISGQGVAGNINMNLGNGNDTVTVIGSPGGVLNWLSGNGNSRLTLLDLPPAGQTYRVNATFGSGDDTFDAISVIAPSILTGRIDGGGRITANVFNQVNFTLAPTLILMNFP